MQEEKNTQNETRAPGTSNNDVHDTKLGLERVGTRKSIMSLTSQQGLDSMVFPQSVRQGKDEKQGEEKYDEFIETSDVLIDFYKNQKTFGLEKYFVMIEDWLKKDIETQEENLPLVIEASEGVGKKTLLIQWIQHHIKNSKQDYDDIFITHFASAGGSNCNSFYATYRILIKLREMFNIKQKVELLEEKIRKNFSYWLYLCSKKAEKSVVYDGKIILIIEGLESFTDYETRNESNVKFWLPKCFPKNVRVIVTASKSSKSYKYLQSIGSKILKLNLDPKILKSKIQSLEKRNFFVGLAHQEKIFEIVKDKLERKLIRSSLFPKILICTLCPYETPSVLSESEVDIEKIQDILALIEFSKLENCNRFESFMEFVLEFFEDKIVEPAKFRLLFSALVITFKGLKVSELLEICDITLEDWKLFLAFFKSVFFTFRGLWRVGSNMVIRFITKKYHQDREYLKSVHLKIAKVIDKANSHTIRILEELTNHYFRAERYHELKQTIATIDTFLLLFNPYTKYDLCRYWQVLEGKGYDPVVQYNEGLELFDMHYSPKPGDLFTIILQISRFLKEFSDFETKNTPKFRHPYIKGKMVMKRFDSDDEILEALDDGLEVTDSRVIEKRSNNKEQKKKMRESIRKAKDKLLQERENFNILQFLKVNSKDAKKYIEENIEAKASVKDLPFKEELDTFYAEVPRPPRKTVSDSNTLDYLEDIGLAEEIKAMKMTKEQMIRELGERGMDGAKRAEVLKKEESYNFDVASGKENFLNYFRGILKKINHRDKLISDEDDLLKPYFYIKEYEEGEVSSNEGMDMMEMSKREHIIKEKEDLMNKIDEIDLIIQKEIEPTYYYYKRWLWMTFPWACLQQDQRFSFSKLINQCYSSNLKYLSFEEDKLLTSHAIKIVRETKAKRKAMIYKQNDHAKGTKGVKQLKPLSTNERLNTDLSIGIDLEVIPDAKSKAVTRYGEPMTKRKLDKMSKTDAQIFKRSTKNKKSNRTKKIRLPSLAKKKSMRTRTMQSNNQSSISRKSKMKKTRTMGKALRKKPRNKSMAASAQNFNMKRKQNFDDSVLTTENFYGSKQNASQLTSTERFNFFSNIKKDKGKIIQFMNQSQILDQKSEDRVSKILAKSRFWEERLKSYLISAPMKQRLLQSKSTKSLVSLKNQLEDHTKKEINILQRKNQDLIAELNKVSNRLRLQKREMSRFQSTLDNMRQPSKADYNRFLKKKEDLLQKAKNINEKLQQKKTFRFRMERIKEICELNQIQNEEWIRKLTFYQTNLKKAIQDRQLVKDRIEFQHRKINEKIANLVDDYNSRKVMHDSLIQDIGDELQRKKFIDEHISSTDFLIKESVKLKKKDIEEKMNDYLQRQLKAKEFKANEKLHKQMNSELDEMRELHEEMKDLFEEGEDGETWDDKVQMRKTVLEIERRKDLEKYLIEKRLELSKIKKEKALAADELKTIKKANKGNQDKMKGTEFLKRNNEMIKEKIKNEKRTVKRCEDFLATSTKIDNDTRLIVASIANILGVHNNENNLGVLLQKSKLEDIVAKVSKVVEKLSKNLSEEDLAQFKEKKQQSLVENALREKGVMIVPEPVMETNETQRSDEPSRLRLIKNDGSLSPNASFKTNGVA